MAENKKFKDTIFRLLFKENTNFVHLYKELTGRVISEEDIKYFDNSSIVINKDLKNDISFLTKDNRFIYLVEHQSSISKNMYLRLLLYYTDIIKDFIVTNELDIFSSEAIKIPSPELYVVYNGERKQDDVTLELKENFLYDLGNISVSVNIVNINYDRIKSKHEHNNFVGYTYFVHSTRKYAKMGFDLSEALEKARIESLEHGFLTDYLNRKEFLNMALYQYTVEQQIENAEANGISKGIKKVAMNLIKINTETDKILQVTGLSKDELEEIMLEIGIQK